MATALLVIDVQDFFLRTAPTNLATSIVNHYESLNYDAIVFSVFKNNQESNFVKSLKWDKCSDHQSSALPTEFTELANSNNTFLRSTYSAFKHTELNNFLKQRQVDQLIICGIDTDACVLATAFEAFD